MNYKTKIMAPEIPQVYYTTEAEKQKAERDEIFRRLLADALYKLEEEDNEEKDS